jgi:hypothetical protein
MKCNGIRGVTVPPIASRIPHSLHPGYGYLRHLRIERISLLGVAFVAMKVNLRINKRRVTSLK